MRPTTIILLVFVLSLLSPTLVLASGKPLGKKRRVLPKFLTNVIIEKPKIEPRILKGPSMEVELTYPSGMKRRFTPKPISIRSSMLNNNSTIINVNRQRFGRFRPCRRPRPFQRPQPLQRPQRVPRPGRPGNPNTRPDGFVGATDEAVYAILESTSGVSSVTAFGITVLPGATARLGYKIRVKAIDARTISNSDKRFRRRLSRRDRRKYDQLKSSYTGGLDLPFMKQLGADLSQDFVPQDDLQQVRDSKNRIQKREYDRQGQEATSILSQYLETEIEAEGELVATGVGTKPVTVFVFLRFAVLKINENDSLSVLSTDTDDVVGGDIDGNGEGSEGTGTIDILPLPTR